VPDDLTIVYLFYPFGEKTLDVVLHNLIESIDRRPRRMHLIYLWPKYNQQVLATGRFQMLREFDSFRMLSTLRWRYRVAIFESCH
jgi:hypothetical protein